MTDEQQADTPEDARAETAWQRKRRLDAIFGDVLPQTTSDERGPDGSAPRSAERADEEWLRAQVPPHHGKT